MHLIDKHMYPKNFFFAITKEGIDGRRSLLNDGSHHRRRSSAHVQSKETRRRASLLDAGDSKQTGAPRPAPPAADEDRQDGDTAPDADMEDLTGAMSSLQFVPKSVRFGKGRAGFSKP